MKLVFLDIDYVLSSYRKAKEVYMITGKRHSGKDFPFDEKCMENLKYLINKTGAYIVITSSWRKYEDHMIALKEKLIEYDLLDRVIGKTNVLGNREEEINEFLNNIKDKISFIILDDNNQIGELTKYLVKTNPYTGLTKQDTKNAILKLRR